ncbi:hypothetical protein Leryth_026542 [Lithospermum erythrorhizon]|nr:hypothetical protein Leryth_026542 [Lithospermum erythrorhizon]
MLRSVAYAETFEAFGHYRFNRPESSIFLAGVEDGKGHLGRVGVDGLQFGVSMHDRGHEDSLVVYRFYESRPGSWHGTMLQLPIRSGLGLMDIWKWNVAHLFRAIWHFYREVTPYGSVCVLLAGSISCRTTRPVIEILSFQEIVLHSGSAPFPRLEGLREHRCEAATSCCVAGRFNTNLVYETLRVHNPAATWIRDYLEALFLLNFLRPLRISVERLATRDSLRFMNLDDVSYAAAFVNFHVILTWSVIRTQLGIRRQMTTLESAIKWIKKEAWKREH